jgi:hypothetical protein
MYKILTLAAAALCTLAFVTPVGAGEGWGSAPSDKALSWQQFRAALDDARWAATTRIEKPGMMALKSGRGVDVVELGVDPDVVEVPSAMSAALQTFDDAVRSFRDAVAENPAALANLRARGYGLDDVLAATREPDGSVVVFVGSAA